MQLNDIETYLRENFQQVDQQSRDGDYQVFSVTTPGAHHVLKVHDYFLAYNLDPSYLRVNDIAGQLRRGGVELYRLPGF